MLKLVSDHDLLLSDWATQLNMDNANKTMVFERNGLIFIFNFHITNSIPDYEFTVPEPGDYKIILNTDNPDFGGHGRIDESIVFIKNLAILPFPSGYG